MNKYIIDCFTITFLFIMFSCNKNIVISQEDYQKDDVVDSCLNNRGEIMFDYFNKSFLVNRGLTYYRDKISTDEPAYFWQQALIILMTCDQYEITKNEEIKSLVSNLLNSFIVINVNNKGENDWSWNNYNDDLAWAGLAFIRGYHITGNSDFLEQAKYSYNLLFDRGYDETLGGGVWWDINHESKSALSNNPVVSLACYIYKATGDSEYLKQAQLIYNWIYNKLFDKSSGAVYEKIKPDGTLVTENADNIYNSGSFIEAATLLYELTNAVFYLNDAHLAAQYVMNVKSKLGVMGRQIHNGSWQSEFSRGMRLLFNVDSQNCQIYREWLALNAEAIWRTKLDDLFLVWNQWNLKTERIDLTSIECISSVVFLNMFSLYD